MINKEILSAVAIALTFIAFVPYIRSILQNKTRPHVFSWVIWGSTTFIVFLAQLAAKGGVGAWPIGISGIITIIVAVLAYIKKSDSSITTLDWIFFISALLSLPFWYITDDPVWAVLILTLVDLLGFGPTLRKAFNDPFSEQTLFYSLFMFRNLLVVLALEHYSLTTVLFPGVIGAACLLLIMMIVYRRWKISRN